MRHKRKKIWIDQFQTYLSLRIGLYFVCYQVAVWALVFFTRHITDALEAMLGAAIGVYCSLFFASTVVLLGFLAIYDTVRFTHRVVGPLYRFRVTMKAIADGEEVALLCLRKGDLLQEMKDDFNAMLTALEARGAVSLKSPDPERDQGRALVPSPQADRDVR